MLRGYGRLRAGGDSVPAAALSFLSDTGVTGSPASSWASALGSVTVTQATGANQPSITASAFGSKDGLTFDGTNDNLSVASRVISATTAGTMSIVFKTPAAITARGVMVSQADPAVANDWWEIGIDSDKKLYIESNASGTKHTVKGATVLTESTVYDLQLCYDGTDFFLQLGGEEENPLVIESTGAYAWIGRINGNFTIGATITSGGAARFFTGSLGALSFWNEDLTA